MYVKFIFCQSSRKCLKNIWINMSRNISQPMVTWINCNVVLVRIILALKQFINKWSQTLMILDFRETFDCVDHDFLLRNLSLYGITDRLPLLIDSLLSNRSPLVSIYDSPTASYRDWSASGFSLALTLFLIYDNDILNTTLYSKVSALCSCISSRQKLRTFKHKNSYMYVTLIMVLWQQDCFE